MRAATRLWIGFLIVATALCMGALARAGKKPPESRADAGAPGDGQSPQLMTHEQRIAWIAEQFVKRQPKLGREDCSGLVESVLAQSGVLNQGSVRMFWSQALAEQRAYRGEQPQPGHLAFFDYTYDANHNGSADDTLTHIGIVTAVDADGTVAVVHRPRSGIRHLQFNLKAPATHRRDGKLLNDYVRAPGYGRRDGRRLAGQLVYGFAAPPAPMVMDWVCGCTPPALSRASTVRSW